MTRFLLLPFFTIALLLTTSSTADAQWQRDEPYRPPHHRGQGGWDPGNTKPRPPKIVEEPEPVSTHMDEQWKWMLAAFVVVLVVYTAWQLLRESARIRPPEKLQPWEIE